MTEPTAKKRQLYVYLGQERIGQLFSVNGSLSFQYEAAYLQNPQARKLSACLPLRENVFSHQNAAPFFSGILPDEDIRRRLAKSLHISDTNIFGFLDLIGGECAGAVSFYREEMITPIADYRILTDDEADRILSDLGQKPLFTGEGGIRISGAGAQEKLILAFLNDRPALPLGSAISTHIVKPPIRGLRYSVFNEFFCMRLAAAVGLAVPAVQIYRLHGKTYYQVTRYDRCFQSDGVAVRIHQEDFCQALGIPPEMKYENEGGPALNDCFDFVNQRIAEGAMAPKEKIFLLQSVIFNFLIGNGDAHGKNFSLLYQENTENFAPLYDLLCTVIYDNPLKAKSAMKIGGAYKFSHLKLRHWRKSAEVWGFHPDFLVKTVHMITKKTERESRKLCEALNADPQTASPIYQEICDVIALHARQLADE